MARNELIFFKENEYGYCAVRFDGNHIRIRHDELGKIGESAITRDEAIAAARAILKHFGDECGPVVKDVW